METYILTLTIYLNLTTRRGLAQKFNKKFQRRPTPYPKEAGIDTRNRYKKLLRKYFLSCPNGPVLVLKLY